jgi:hypothetical protein
MRAERHRRRGLADREHDDGRVTGHYRPADADTAVNDAQGSGEGIEQ